MVKRQEMVEQIANLFPQNPKYQTMQEIFEM